LQSISGTNVRTADAVAAFPDKPRFRHSNEPTLPEVGPFQGKVANLNTN